MEGNSKTIEVKAAGMPIEKHGRKGLEGQSIVLTGSQREECREGESCRPQHRELSVHRCCLIFQLCTNHTQAALM